jgi:hypothetical protein
MTSCAKSMRAINIDVKAAIYSLILSYYMAKKKLIRNRTEDDIQINKYLHNGLCSAIIGHKKQP